MDVWSSGSLVETPRCISSNEDPKDSSPYDDTSSSAPPTSPRRVKRLLPPEPVDMACDIADEVQRCASSGMCDLSQLQLKRVPAELPLQHLVSLALSNNELTELPEELFTDKNCANLVHLDANSNQLKTLPNSLFKLTKLEVLLLDHNEISALRTPEGGDNGGDDVFLPALRRLGLEFNQIENFPVEFFTRCPLLEEMYLGQNRNMLDKPLPTDSLRLSPITHRYHTYDINAANKRVVLKIDNSPRFMQQMKKENWDAIFPWMEIQLNKIYPDKVLGFLYLGSLRTVQTDSVYRELNIGYVLTVARGLDVRIEPGMKHLVLPVDDFPNEDFSLLFTEAFEFIDDARRSDKGVLLHCFAGLSRSATLAAAYIMNRYAMTRDNALDIIKLARPAAQPNIGFMEMLLRYEKKLERHRECGQLGGKANCASEQKEVRV